MSGPLRCRAAAVFILAGGPLLAGLPSSPASANFIDTLLNRAPEDAAAPAPVQDTSGKQDASSKLDALAKDECLSRPGKPVEGQHWMYRLDGHRRCWYPVAQDTATVRMRAHRHAAKRRPAASEEAESAPARGSAHVPAPRPTAPPG